MFGISWANSINKVKVIANNADSYRKGKIIRKFNDECKKINKVIDGCIQINISSENSKSGCSPDELFDIAKLVESMENINLKGIVALPKLTNDKKERDHMMEEVINLSVKLQDLSNASAVSLGTTSDYEDAIIHGSNMLRIGESILVKDHEKYIIFGGGNIAQALISGLLLNGMSNKNVFVDRNPANQKLKSLKVKSLKKSTSDIDIVILSVKPKDAIQAYKEILNNYKNPKIVSLVAGIKSSAYTKLDSRTEFMRAMPNTASKYGYGITALYNSSFKKVTLKKHHLSSQKWAQLLK